MPVVASDAPPQNSVAPGPQIPYPPYPFFVPQRDDEINLIDLFRVLWRRKWLIVLVTVVGTSAAAAYALLATPIYRAKAVIAPPKQQQRAGASAALAAFGGFGAEIAGSLGFSLGGADASRLEALLNSHRLISNVVEKNQLMPVLFNDQWDPASKTWKVKDQSLIPNIWDAEKYIKSILTVDNDQKTGSIILTVEYINTETAIGIIHYFLSELSTIMQQDELNKIEKNRKFIELQLSTAKDPVIVARLHALFSEQIEKAMMAQNVGSFAYELIDPPAVSDQKVKPKRALIGTLGLAASAILGMFLAISAEWVAKARKASTPGAEGSAATDKGNTR